MSSNLLIALGILCVAFAPLVRLVLRKEQSVGSAVLLGTVAMAHFAFLSLLWFWLQEPFREADLAVQAFALIGFAATAWLSSKLIQRLKPIRQAREKMLDAGERADREAQAKHNTYQPMVLNDQ